MLIFRGGAVSRGDVSPSALQAHLEKWYAWSDELTRQGRRNLATPLDNGGRAVRDPNGSSPTGRMPSPRIWSPGR